MPDNGKRLRKTIYQLALRELDTEGLVYTLVTFEIGGIEHHAPCSLHYFLLHLSLFLCPACQHNSQQETIERRKHKAVAALRA